MGIVSVLIGRKRKMWKESVTETVRESVIGNVKRSAGVILAVGVEEIGREGTEIGREGTETGREIVGGQIVIMIVAVAEGTFLETENMVGVFCVSLLYWIKVSQSDHLRMLK